MFSDSNNTTTPKTPGILKIKVPHWIVQIRIYDNAYKLIEFINNFPEADPVNSQYKVEKSLKPGIYEIEVAVANKVERSLIKIKAGNDTEFELSKEEMESMLQDSAMLNKIIISTNTKTSDGIIPWSSFKKDSTGDSGLCLYVKVPKDYFSLHLNFTPEHLLAIFNIKKVSYTDGPYTAPEMVSVIDFNKDLTIFQERGEIFLNKELPPGLYIAEWLCSEKKTSHQIIYLYKGWFTLVSLSTDVPVGKSFFMNMIRKDRGFDLDNEAEVATKAVFAAFNQDVRRSIVLKDEMKPLLAEESCNPWLGILAAYALIPDFSTQQPADPGDTDTRSGTLFNEILNALKHQLPDHPDVHALCLAESKPAEHPLSCPPMLFKGLQRVNKHAEKFVSTIPVDSFTDCILQSILLNSPWVNWYELTNASQRKIIQNTEADAAGNFFSKETDAGISGTAIVDLKETISLKAPVFKLSFESPLNPGTTGAPESSQVSCSFSTLQEVSMINTMQEITKYNYYDVMPDKLKMNSMDSLYNTLIDANPNKIVYATNLPAMKVNAGITSILQKKDEITGVTLNEPNSVKLSRDEQLVMKYALQEAGKNKAPDAPGYDSDSVKNIQMPGHTDSESRNITIEECVSQLKAEANRILFGSSKNSLAYTVASENFSYRLKNVANEVLKRADFMVTTNSEGKTVYGNGAFIQLISDGLNTQNEVVSVKNNTLYSAKVQNRKNNLFPWERALESLPLGKSSIKSPVYNNFFENWSVKRSEMEDQAQKDFKGFINILRGQDAPLLNQEDFKKITDYVSKLKVYAPLYALYFNESGTDYAEKFEFITQELEKLVI